MAYSTLADLKKAIPEANLIAITDDENLAVVNEGRVTQAIEDADALIDTYLRGKHTVPLSTVPVPIRRASVDLATYYLYSRRMEFEPTESMQNKYKEHVRFLEAVRDGKNLLNDIESAANTGGIYKTNKTSSSQVFDTDLLDTY